MPRGRPQKARALSPKTAARERKRRQRSDENYRREERERNTEAKRRLRSNEKYRREERQRNTEAKRRQRCNEKNRRLEIQGVIETHHIEGEERNEKFCKTVGKSQGNINSSIVCQNDSYHEHQLNYDHMLQFRTVSTKNDCSDHCKIDSLESTKHSNSVKKGMSKERKVFEPTNSSHFSKPKAGTILGTERASFPQDCSFSGEKSSLSLFLNWKGHCVRFWPHHAKKLVPLLPKRVDNNLSQHTNKTIIDNPTSNTFITMPTNNAFIGMPINNTIISMPMNNTIISSIPTNNTVIPYPTCNAIISDTTNNTIIPDHINNTIIPDMTSNTIIPDPTNNTIISDLKNNTIISDPTNNTIISDPTNNTIISDPTNNTIISDPTSIYIIPDPTNIYIIPDSISNCIIPNPANSYHEMVRIKSEHTDNAREMLPIKSEPIDNDCEMDAVNNCVCESDFSEESLIKEEPYFICPPI